MVDRVEGEDVQAAWPTFSQDAKTRIAEQTANFLQPSRNLQSGKMAGIGEAPLYAGLLFLEGAGTHMVVSRQTTSCGSLVRTLEKLPEKARDAFRKRLPPCAPHTFAHGDLATVNIIVKDGNLAAITDWERAGYFPAWWEYTAARIGLGKEDVKWGELLASKMQRFEEGRAFFGRTLTD